MIKKVSTGIPGIDSILNGGIPNNKSVLVSGNCGTGKTILASHFIKEGGGVYISFEQDRDKLFEDLKQVGVDLKILEKKGKLKLLGGNLIQIQNLKDKRKAKARDIIEEIVEVIQELKAKKVVIDSINLFLLLFDTNRERRNIMYQLMYALEQEDCTVLLTCELPERKEGLSWFGFEEFVCDGVFLLSREYNKDLNMNKRYIEVVKLRGTNYKEGNFQLKITDKGMKVLTNDPNCAFFDAEEGG